MTEGELTFWFGGQVTEAPAGSFVYGPRDRSVMPKLIYGLKIGKLRYPGGGQAALNTIYIANLVDAINLARSKGAKVFGIVGRDGGFTKKSADACVVTPQPSPAPPRTRA